MPLTTSCLWLKALSWHGREGWQMYLRKNRKKKKLPHVVRFLPPAVRIACGLVSAHSGGPYSCSSLYGTAFFCVLKARMEPHDVFRGGRTRRDFSRDIDLSQAPVLRWQSSNGNCHPSLRGRKEQIILLWELENLEMGKPNREVLDILLFWQESVLFEKVAGQEHYVSKNRW